MRAASTASLVIPAIRTSLFRPFSPETSVTFFLGTPRARARNRARDSFAFPSTGGAFTRTRRTPPAYPATPSFAERGTTRTGKVAAVYAQDFQDAVAIAAVSEVEDLTTGLSRRRWQKIALVEAYRARAS